MKNSNFDLTDLQAEIKILEKEKQEIMDNTFEKLREANLKVATLLAKNGELQENYAIILETHNHFLNKPIYAQCDKLEAKVKDLEAKVEGNGWQTIETAPQDGTKILVCGGNKSSDLSKETSLDTPMVVRWDAGEQVWEAQHTCYYGVYADSPTHWAKLPQIPTKG
jgi:hypothetical protein